MNQIQRIKAKYARKEAQELDALLEKKEKELMEV